VENNIKKQGGEDAQDALKSQVIFRKRATNYRALLWRTFYKDKDPMGLRQPARHPMLLRYPVPLRVSKAMLCFYAMLLGHPVPLRVTFADLLPRADIAGCTPRGDAAATGRTGGTAFRGYEESSGWSGNAIQPS